MSLQFANAVVPNHQIREASYAEFLDEVYLKLKSGRIKDGMMQLGKELHELYASTTTAEWEKLAKYELFNHPLFHFLQQDPLTAHSFRRPRGYAGDAELLDMVYFPENIDFSSVTDAGKQLFGYTSRTSLSLALIERLKLIARIIDETINANENTRILSVASGHSRELSFSLAYKAGLIKQFVALDHDAASLTLAEREYTNINIEFVCQSVANLIRHNRFERKFDLIYSAGLYDYLNTRFAQKLTKELFNLLAPGGKLVLMNIDSDYEEIGYMESYMNWSMIGRTALDLLELADQLQSSERATINLVKNENVNSHFHTMEIIRN